MRWQDRVIGLEYHKGREIHDHPRQWRLHPVVQQQALWGVLEEIGKAGALRVYRGDGSLFPGLEGELIAIDGHLRKGQDLDEPWPCVMLDVTDAESCTLIAVYDPMAAMAGADAGALAELLEQVSTEDEAVQRLLDEIAAEAAIPESWPEYDESIADEVEYLECPECGHKWPK